MNSTTERRCNVTRLEELQRKLEALEKEMGVVKLKDILKVMFGEMKL